MNDTTERDQLMAEHGRLREKARDLFREWDKTIRRINEIERQLPGEFPDDPPFDDEDR